MEKLWIVRLIIFAILIHEIQCETGMCFACRDSSSNKGKNDCQVNTKRMEELHTKLFHEYGNNTDVFMKDFKDDPYVQNCSALTNHSYCCIEEFEGGGFIKAYIRTCCDGKTWSFDTDKLRTLKNIQKNNDSLCQHNTESLTTTCVRMCRGNFCNGPTSAANNLHTYETLTQFSFILFACFFVTVTIDNLKESIY